MAKGVSPESLDEAELELFIAKTLKAVIGGIADASKSTRVKGGGILIDEEMRIPLQHRVEFGLPAEVAFDVAVTVNRKRGANGGLKIEVLSLGANIGGDATREQSVASRVSFKIPVNWKGR